MSNIGLITSGLPVDDIRAELEACNGWNVHKQRTENPTSPHREVDDIWIRYNPIRNYAGDMQEFAKEHIAEWYPVAYDLPITVSAVMAIADTLDAREIGAVLVTRVPPGRKVYPHTDKGWHAEYYDKVALQIRGNKDQAFCFDDESLSANPGDLYWFHNLVNHWVENNSNEDRITLIICVKR